ncbi:hypothetical protein SAMN05216223_126100 [Actinacidiphila yanglinensis]|uniref:Uncharacterized protein n=1 Tax=Actinacidiphila yanglinensis TaxID=310779 RepID=A0A1H6E4X8_9ACTN|nr:hypothetical protein [Actinacidiphila yanglinensis]SEG92798.1 hypothetical protein SAMN05216223_126100 [Actinacidiphila yanglinensis]
MEGSRRVGRSGIPRLLAVCALLAGLFLMHGSPAAAAGGCHGAMPSTMAAPMSAGGASGAAPASLPSGGHAPAGHAAGGHEPGSPSWTGPAVRAAAPSMAHGGSCVSTPAREHSALPIDGLVVVVAALAAAGIAELVVVRGRTRRRGPPPPGGRGLLLQVGVART